MRADVLSISSSTGLVGNSVDLPVMISGATDLYAFQFDVSFNPDILQLQAITEGSFLPSAGPTLFIPGIIDNTAGNATFNADTLIGAVPGGQGAGTLLTLDFSVVGGGTSSVDLANVVLLDSNLNDISFTTQAGQVAVPEGSGTWLVLALLLGCAVRFRRASTVSRIGRWLSSSSFGLVA